MFETRSHLKSLLATAAVALFLAACGAEDEQADPSGICDCTPEQSCVEGVCVDPECADSSECGIGRICESGACVPDTNGSECSIDSDCDGGRCVEGACFTTECSDGDTRPCATDCGDGVEVCRNGLFANCDAPRPIPEICIDEIDNDCNGVVDDGCDEPVECEEGDEEVCFDGLDNDCDGDVDEDCPECENGRTEECETECETGIRVCEEGVWGRCSAPGVAEEVCDGVDNDCDGEVDEELALDCSTACGEGVQACVDGVYGECDAPTVCDCEDGETDRQVCGNCGVRERTCVGSTWGDWSACTDEGTCSPGTAETRSCGPGTSEGICMDGTETRVCSDACEWNDWGECSGAVFPGFDLCGDGVDQDCDGEDRIIDDEYEPNDTCETAFPLGEDPDTVVFGTISHTGDGSDYFRFTAVDNTNINPFTPNERIYLQLDMGLLLSSSDYDLYLYRDLASCRADSAMASSANPGNTDEEITVEEVWNSEDGGEYYIEVRRFTGSDCLFEYALTVDGLRLESE